MHDVRSNAEHVVWTDTLKGPWATSLHGKGSSRTGAECEGGPGVYTGRSRAERTDTAPRTGPGDSPNRKPQSRTGRADGKKSSSGTRRRQLPSDKEATRGRAPGREVHSSRVALNRIGQFGVGRAGCSRVDTGHDIEESTGHLAGAGRCEHLRPRGCYWGGGRLQNRAESHFRESTRAGSPAAVFRQVFPNPSLHRLPSGFPGECASRSTRLGGTPGQESSQFRHVITY